MKKSVSGMFVLATLLCAYSPAMADQMGPQGDKFYEEAAHFENACHNFDTCTGGVYGREVVFSQPDHLNRMPDNTSSELAQIATAQAQIWGDTILEGDYHADGHTRLDSVIAYYKKGQLVGYKIEYSEKAWYTGDCEFDGTAESLGACQPGRIVEGSYVSADLQTFFSDEERYAEFNTSSL